MQLQHSIGNNGQSLVNDQKRNTSVLKSIAEILASRKLHMIVSSSSGVRLTQISAWRDASVDTLDFAHCLLVENFHLCRSYLSHVVCGAVVSKVLTTSGGCSYQGTQLA